MDFRLLPFLFVMVLASIVMGAPQSAQAEQVLMQCSKTAGSSGWLPDAFTYVREAASKKITVSDPIILRRLRAPVSGKIVRESRGQMVLTWKIKGMRDSRGTTTAAMVYRAVVKTADMSFKITASPLGFSETFSGRGKCKKVPAKQVKALSKKIKSAGKVAEKNGGMIHTLWKVGQNRSFSCKLGQPRKPYDWSLRQVSVHQKAKSKTATIEFLARGSKTRSKAKARVVQKKKYVLYRWAHSVDDPKGRGFTEPAKAVVEYYLAVDMYSGRASLQSSATPTRRKSSSRVGAGCK